MCTEDDLELKRVGLELMFLTPEKYSNAEGITAVELSKRVELPVDVVKKKLAILKEWTKMMKFICSYVVLMM